MSHQNQTMRVNKATMVLYRIVAIFAIAMCVVGLARHALAAGTDAGVRWHEAGVARVHSGSSWVDVSAGVYTSYLPLITIEPPTGTGMTQARVVLDLDGGNDADGFAGGYTSETIRFAVGRKIQGQWRIDTESQSATVAGTAAGDRSVTLDIGIVGAQEDVRVYVLVSTEQTDIDIPYVFYYLAPNDAVFTDVTN